jgi:DNA-binding MarR family transcriptional regulator
MTDAVADRDHDTAAPSDAQPSLGVLAPLLGFRMRRIHNHLTRSFSDRLGEMALKPGGFSALGLMAANPGMSQNMLSAELGQDKATVVALLDEMEARGWAERRRAVTDRRRHHLYITEAGAAALARMASEAFSNESRVVAALTPEESTMLLGLLDKVYHGCFRTEN